METKTKNSKVKDLQSVDTAGASLEHGTSGHDKKYDVRQRMDNYIYNQWKIIKLKRHNKT
jgi:hypothetical protein